MPTLENAIQTAIETHKADLPSQDQSGLDNAVDDAQQQQAEPEPEPEPEVVPELDEETLQGRDLVRALKDPTKAPFVIDWLARQNGYTKDTVSTKKDVVEAKKDLTSILEEELGADLKFMAPKLGKALEKYLDSIKKEPSSEDSDTLKNLRERVESTERREIQAELLQTHTAIAKEFFGTDDMPTNVASAMSKAMEDFPPNNANVEPKVYYRKIFNFVIGELGLQKSTSNQRDRAASNRANVPSNLTRTQKGVTPDPNGNPRKMSLEQSVRLALEQVEQGSKK